MRGTYIRCHQIGKNKDASIVLVHSVQDLTPTTAAKAIHAGTITGYADFVPLHDLLINGWVYDRE